MAENPVVDEIVQSEEYSLLRILDPDRVDAITRADGESRAREGPTSGTVSPGSRAADETIGEGPNDGAARDATGVQAPGFGF